MIENNDLFDDIDNELAPLRMLRCRIRNGALQGGRRFVVQKSVGYGSSATMSLCTPGTKSEDGGACTAGKSIAPRSRPFQVWCRRIRRQKSAQKMQAAV